MALSASDAGDRVEQLTSLTERLTARLRDELKSFETRRPHQMVATQPETANLANLYRRESQKVKADPSLIAGAPNALIARLRSATEAFEAVLARHVQVLQAAKTLTEGLVHAIATEIMRQRSPVSTYGADARSNQTQARAMTLNRRA